MREQQDYGSQQEEGKVNELLPEARVKYCFLDGALSDRKCGNTIRLLVAHDHNGEL